MTRTYVLRASRPAVSFRVGSGTLLVVVGALVGTLAMIAVGVGSGTFPIAPLDVLVVLGGGGTEDAQYVVWSLRVPRLMCAVLVGASLGVSGAIFQGLSRNPLVSPDVIGVNGGAALAVVSVIVLGMPSGLIGPAAFVGGMTAAIAVYALSWRGGLGRFRPVLIGIGIGALAEAGIGYLLTRAELMELTNATIWLIGGLHASSWGDVMLLTASFGILFSVALVLGRGLEMLQLGDDAAAGLGLSTERTRLTLVMVAVGLAAFSVSVGGPIAFVALIAPHVARILARASGSGLLPTSAAVGALLVIGADVLARRLADPIDLPVGIVTVLLGAPFFLWLLVRADRLGSAA